MVFEQSFVICPWRFPFVRYLILCLDGSLLQRTEITENSKREKFITGEAGRLCLTANSPVEPSGGREKQHHKASSWGWWWEKVTWVLMVGRQQQRGEEVEIGEPGIARYGVIGKGFGYAPTSVNQSLPSQLRWLERLHLHAARGGSQGSPRPP